MISGTMELQVASKAEQFIAYMKSFCVEHRCSNTINIEGMKFVFTCKVHPDEFLPFIAPYLYISGTGINGEKAEEMFIAALGE